MNAALEKQLAALSLEEKTEIIDFLLPDVADRLGETETPELLAEIDQRIEEYEADPSTSISLEEFRKKGWRNA